jgi:hypothetical protein
MSQISIGLLAVLCAGCFPMRAQVRSPQSGRIVDGNTGVGVSGAKVIIESWQVATPPGRSYMRELLHSVDTVTTADGHWSVDGEKDWKLAILAADGFPLFVDTACVSAPGYQTFVMNPWANQETAKRDKQSAGPDFKQGTVPQQIALTPAAGGQSLQTPGTGPSRCGIPEQHTW